jgi:hypothetical protein
MKVLVATADTQGERRNDYHWCIEGEPVFLFEPCAADLRDPDGGCGCGRGFAGLTSHRATTTARVAEVALTQEEYAEAIRSSLAEQGWGADPCDAEADALRALVADWPVGTVVERRLDDVIVRRLPLFLPR